MLTESVSRYLDTEAISVGRDGASDAISFIAAGVPAVEFGPAGQGTTARRNGYRSPRCRSTNSR